METAGEVIKDILHEILEQTSQQLVDSVDSNTVMRYMNRFMATLAVTSPLGYTKVDSLSDIITIHDGAIEGLIFNTAIRLAPSYDIIPNALLLENAKNSLATMVLLASTPIITTSPDTLPLGSGNKNSFSGSRFSPSQEDAVLNEQGITILVETNT